MIIMLNLGNHEVYTDHKTSLYAAWMIRHWRWLNTTIFFLCYRGLSRPLWSGLPLSAVWLALPTPYMAFLSERSKHSQVSKCTGPSRTYWPFSLERPLSFQLTLHLFPMPCLQTVQTREMYRAKPWRLWCWISYRNRPTRTFSKLQSVAKAPWIPANSGPQQWERRDGREGPFRPTC